MCVFGAAAGSIFLLIVDRAKGNNAWETGMNYNILYSGLLGVPELWMQCNVLLASQLHRFLYWIRLNVSLLCEICYKSLKF